jgi:flagellar basal body-associated protein FliL
MRMESTESSAVPKRSALVIIVVLVGISTLAAGGYLAWSKRHSGGGAVAASSPGIAKWCELRQEWARKVDPLAGDIMLKGVKPEDKPAHEQVRMQREKLCNEYASKVREVVASEPAVQAVETALVKEGKVRANVAVEIYNQLQQAGSDEMPVLAKARDSFKTGIADRIRQGRESADREVKAALAAIGSPCSKIYRGPMTDKETADSPYVTWDELEMQRTTALAKFDARIRELEPQEEFANRVYHELVRLHRGLLVSCHASAKAKNAKLPNVIGLQIRLKKSGEVKTLAIVVGDDDKDHFVDCLGAKAAKWKLPRPDAKTQVTVVTLDFSKI